MREEEAKAESSPWEALDDERKRLREKITQKQLLFDEMMGLNPREVETR